MAEQTAFGNGGLNSGGARSRRAWSSRCARGHEYTAETTRYTKRAGRIHRVCKLCKKKPLYNAREYPL